MIKGANNQPIGVFDSGIGGLTVVKALRERLPGEEIIYLGDTARVPYGVKSPETIYRYAMESTLFLLNRGVKIVVAACNTVSAVALPRLRDLLRAPLIGVLEPGVRTALKNSISRRIGVIGTPSTIHSGAYQDRLRELDKSVRVTSQSCPLLVPLAEEGRLDGEIVTLVLREYLEPLINDGVDSVILGCTHYPLFKKSMSELLGDQIRLIDSAEAVAVEVENVLLREGLVRTYGKGSVQCFVTDLPLRFKQLSRLFFGEELANVKHEILGE